MKNMFLSADLPLRLVSQLSKEHCFFFLCQLEDDSQIRVRESRNLILDFHGPFLFCYCCSESSPDLPSAFVYHENGQDSIQI